MLNSAFCIGKIERNTRSFICTVLESFLSYAKQTKHSYRKATRIG